MGSLSDRIRSSHCYDRHARNRPIRLTSEFQAGAIRNPVSTSAGIRNGCLLPQLGEVLLPLSISTSEPSTKNCFPSVVLQNEGTHHHATQTYSPLVSFPDRKVPAVSVNKLPATNSPGKDHTRLLSYLRTLDRMGFMRAVYRRSYSSQVTDLLLSAHRPSSVRQQQSVWKNFKSWLPSYTTKITKSTLLEYLAYLFDVKKLCSRTIMSYRAALALPLKIAFNIDTSDIEFNLEARGTFNRRPPNPRITPSWSISEVLNRLSSPPFIGLNITTRNLFYKTIILTALASGSRSSEMAAFNRACIRNSTRGLLLPVKQGFLLKNQSINRTPESICIPSLVNSSLCPVKSLLQYIERTNQLPHNNHLFLQPLNNNPLKAASLGRWLVKAINSILPLDRIRPHDVRKIAYSLSWSQGMSMASIISKGFWSTPNVFIDKYLVDTQCTQPCIAGQSTINF